MKVKFYLLLLVALLCSNLSSAQESFHLSINPENHQKDPNSINAQCPNDIEVDAAPGANGAYVNWNPINISTNCSYCTSRIPNCVYMGDFNGHQYYCSLFETNHSNASAYARSFSSYLGSINSASENSFLSSQLINNSAYIGLSDFNQESYFEWESQENLSFENWATGMPNDPTGQKDAVEMKTGGKWADCSPTDIKEFIIEFPCIDVELVHGLPNGSYFPIGTTSVYYKFTDACGHETYCQFNVTVNRTGGGIDLNCPDDIWAECQDGLNGAYVSWPWPTATTDCQCTNVVPNCVDMGWENGKQFFCSLFNSTWNDANQWAQNQNSELTIIRNQAENQHLANQLTQNSAYIGLHDPNGTGNFTWVDGTALGYTNWDQGEPALLGTNTFAVMNPNGKWKTVPGWEKKEFIIQKKCLTITQTGGPGMGSFFPLGDTEVEYTAIDKCGNQVTCSFTVSVEGGVSIECPDDITVPCEPSWQGNYVSWNEPQAWSCCQTCQHNSSYNGFIYMGNHNGSSYYCSTFDANWSDAEQHCQQFNGHLATIESSAENNFLASQLMNQSAYIGLSDHNVEGIMRWSSGSNSSYRNWNSGVSNTNTLDFTLLTPNAKWTLADHYKKHEFIMEKPCLHIEQIEGDPSGSFFTEGTHRIRYRVTDGCGDVEYCSFYVTVEPCCSSQFSLHCPRDYIGCPGDDRDPSNTGTASIDQAIACNQIDISYRDVVNRINDCRIEIERIWTAQDRNNSSNRQTCSQWIDLIDQEAPYFTDFPDDLELCPGEDLPVNQNVWADDDCLDVSIAHVDSLVSGDCREGSVYYRIFTATDFCGNFTREMQQITIMGDTIPPVFTDCPDDIELEAEGEDCSRKVYWSSPRATDQCVAPSVTSNFTPGQTFSEGIHEVIYIAEDNCGNRDTCKFTITITAENCCGAPGLTCPSDYQGCPGQPTHPVHTGYPIVLADTANCGRYELGFWDEVVNPGACPGSVTIERLWDVYYYNNAGEKEECWQTIELIDEIPPVITNCTSNIIIESDSCCDKQVFWQPPLATDNCGLLGMTSDYQPGDYFPPGSTTVTYTATDLCGNQSQCFITVHVDCQQNSQYCMSRGLSSESHWIESIEINDQEHISGNNCGFGAINDLELLFESTRSYTLRLKPGSTLSNSKGYWRVWIDLNRDGDFEDALEKVVDMGQLVNGMLETNLYIPSFAADGTSLMRVSYQIMETLDPEMIQECCSEFAIGEVEDYKIHLNVLTNQSEQESVSASKMIVYPNPTDGAFSLELTNKINLHYNILIYNVLGNVVYKNTSIYYQGSKDNYDISFCKGGVYIIEVQTADQKYTEQLVLRSH